MEAGLFKSEFQAESNTKLDIGLVTGCDFAVVAVVIVSNKVLIRSSFFFISFFSNFISIQQTAEVFPVDS